MPTRKRASLASIPSVDRLLRHQATTALTGEHGRQAAGDAIRAVLDEARAEAARGLLVPADDALLVRVAEHLRDASQPTMRRVFNLTGVVLHTNLGRAVLPADAIDAIARAAAHQGNLEFDLDTGRRGNRGTHVETLICQLTGAEAAAVVNNNAAAVLLVLNTVALRREVPASRGELVEIGGSFRMPELMARAGCRLREVGTTNRTHVRDYDDAIGPKTGLVIKVHTSNYRIEGFSATVGERELARLCHDREVPFVVDLGSGSLVDLRRYGLPHEPTAAETLDHGADLVTFSGDKLLGGPQAGIIAGRADLVARVRKNPLMRALRLDKLTLAALGAVLGLYRNPERLVERLPTLRLLSRPRADIEATAARLHAAVAGALNGLASVEVSACESEIGSGALPTRLLPSAGLTITPRGGRRGRGASLEQLAAAFRALPIPIIGRRQGGALILDLRCLDDEAAFTGQLDQLHISATGS